MKIAQSCLNCKEFFVTKVRLKTCPFCEKALPEKVEKQIKQPTIKINMAADKLKTSGNLRDILNALSSEELLQIRNDVLNAVVEEPSTDIIKEFVGVREQAQLLYNLVYGFLGKNTEFIKSKQLKSEELCDFGFFCRELEHILDELRKEVKARKELCSQIIAFRKTQESIQDPSIKMKVQGQFATGTPDVKMQAELPKKFTDEYYKVTDHFGVPRNVAESGVLRLDWKAVTEHCTKLVQDGKRIPEGFGRKYPLYVTVYRKRKVK